MGVPHFYTWLVNRYPLVKSTFNEANIPAVDWFFMDLNGVIYKCAMDDSFAFKDMIKGKRFEEIFVQIFNYVNEIIQSIQPQQMIFLAFDGVAPKAKMNQQRARRFKSAKKYTELDNALRSFGIIDKDEHFQNNSISPGTEFMCELSKHMQFLIQRKMKEDDRWRNVQVIFSGVEVPGEGEHKLLDYIRFRVQQPDFNPNTTVCIYGPDADLIMLALTTHLPFVCILREQLKPRTRVTSACKRSQKKDAFDFLWINVLREYFEIEFSPLKEKMKERYNVEKIIDDFIFLCFFIGNDFLPRVFCLDIKIGSFDKLIEIFKETLIESDGYINEKGVICWYRAVKLFQKIAEFELKFIGEKLEEQENQQKQQRRFKEMMEGDDAEDLKELIAEGDELRRSYEDFDKEFDAAKTEAEKDAAKLLMKEIKKEKKEKKDSKKFTPKIVKEAEEHSKNQEFEGEEDLLNAGIANIEEAERYLNQYSNEEKITKLLSHQILDKDIKFMSSLVRIYKGDTTDAKKYYYEEKYRINVSKNPQELTPILTAYMQGLQFVLSYYYTGCPSWVWFYPYYYSPLISDLSNLMNHLNLPHTTENLVVLEKGKAYDPFKQLLLILPIGSLHLLPEPLRKVVCDENAPLHPYYPTEFEVDPFGAVFETEYIAKIPFVDEKLLDEEYSKGIKNAVLKPEEALRNRLGSNITYQWDSNIGETEVKATLPMYFEDFKVQIRNTTFFMEDLNFDPKKILDGLPTGSWKYHRSFPSLHFLTDKQPEMKEFQKREVTFYKCCFKVKEPLAPGVPGGKTDYKKFLNQVYRCNYPFLTDCVIIGIITPEQLITNLQYGELPFPYSKGDHANYYKDLSLNIHDVYFNEYGILLEKTSPNFAIVSCESELRKDSLGNLYCQTPIFDVIPLDLIISPDFAGRYRATLDLAPMKLSQEFPLNSEVIVNIGEHIGARGQVVGYSRNSFEFDQIEVQITHPVPRLSNVTRDLSSKYDTQHTYSSVPRVAKQLGVDVLTVLQVLDAVVIKTEVSEGEKSVYPDRFDLGLNLINRKNHTIVPEHVICHELEFEKRRSKSFPHFQLSVHAVEIITEYYRQFREIFVAVGQKIENKDSSILTAEYIFPNSRDPNLELLKAYIWLIKQDTANLILANKASKVLPKEGVTELEKFLNRKEYLNSKEFKKAATSKVIPLNPNFLVPKYENTWVPPLYFKKPFWHHVGDRIVNLKINGRNFAPFGACGTVIGILGNKPENGVWEVKIEVMFDQPFLGGTNLGGRCTWGRGAVVDFDDIFNLGWDKFVKPRDRRRNQYYEGWDGVINRSYVPSFQTTVDAEEAEAKAAENKPFEIISRDQQARNAPGYQPIQPNQKVEVNQLQQLQELQGKIQQTQQRENPQNQLNQLKQLQEMSSQIKSQNQSEQMKQLQALSSQIQSQNQNEQSRHLQDFSKQIKQQNVQVQNKQLEAFTNIIKTQNQPGNSQGQDQNQQFKQLYEFTNQIQSNQSNSQPKANTFIPKTLKVKQNAPASTQSTSFQPGKAQGQGDFNFNAFLNTNLAQSYQGAPSVVNPSTSSTEGFLKEALKLPTQTQHEQQQTKPKKGLKLSAQSYTIAQRPEAPQQVAPAQSTENVLQNLFANAQLLNQNTGSQNVPGEQPVMNVEQLEKKDVPSSEQNQSN